MAVDVVTTVDIERERAAVAAFASDPGNATAWYENIKRVEWKTTPPVSVGSRIAFVSANGWDAAGAKAFGFTTFWINRDGWPIERHAPTPDYIIGSLGEVPGLADAEG